MTPWKLCFHMIICYTKATVAIYEKLCSSYVSMQGNTTLQIQFPYGEF